MTDKQWWRRHLTKCSKNDVRKWKRGFQTQYPLGDKKK